MKKLIVLGLVCMAASSYAESYTIRSNGSSGSDIDITQDTSWTAIVDTSLSDTVDISTLSRYVQIHVAYNLGVVNLCDSCNDSVIIIVHTMTKNPNSVSGKIIYTDTLVTVAQLNGSAITTFDESTDWKLIPADSLFGTKLYFRTIVKDAITHAWTGATPSAATRLLQVPLNMEVTVRKEVSE